MWAVVGALLAFAPAASAATYGLTLAGAKIYASEVITSSTEVSYDETEPTVAVFLGLSDAEAANVEEDDTLEVTVKLANAMFADAIRESDMAVTTTITACDIRVKEVDDGAAGDSEVTFVIEAGTADCTCSSCGANVNMTFTLPDLTGLNSRRAVTVTAETTAPGGSNWLDTSAVAGTNLACPQTGAECVDLTNGVLERQSATRTAVPLITFASGFTFSGTNGGSLNINLEGGRTAFVWPHQGYLGSVTLGIASAAECTQRNDPPADCILQADGHPFSVERRGDGKGDLEIAVTGDFRQGDLVWLDVNGNHAPDGSELLSLGSDGVMRGAFGLDRTAGSRSADESAAERMLREEGVVSHNLIYRPNHRDPLRPGDYRARFNVDFDDADVSDPDEAPSSGAFTTSYTTIEDQQYAYAIPPIGAGDQSQVRIKCEVATQCVVYLECDDTQGDSSFAQLGDAISGRSTRTLSSEDISEALGLGADGWQGRLACTVHSTRSIAVQVLTRATNGVLVNNTYVDS